MCHMPKIRREQNRHSLWCHEPESREHSYGQRVVEDVIWRISFVLGKSTQQDQGQQRNRFGQNSSTGESRDRWASSNV